MPVMDIAINLTQKELEAINAQQEQVETEWTEQAEALEELN
mgnify:CR=1 FL=1